MNVAENILLDFKKFNNFEDPRIETQNLSPIWVLDWELIKDRSNENLGDFRLGDDVWELKETRETLKKGTTRKFDFTKLDNLDLPNIDGVKKRMKRYCWLLLTATTNRIVTRIRKVHVALNALIKLSPFITSETQIDSCPDGYPLFKYIKSVDFNDAIEATHTDANSYTYNKHLRGLIDDLFKFSSNGYVKPTKDPSLQGNVYQALSDEDATELFRVLLKLSDATEFCLDYHAFLTAAISKIGNPEGQPFFKNGDFKTIGTLRYAANGKTKFKEQFADTLLPKYVELGIFNKDGSSVFQSIPNIYDWNVRANYTLIGLIDYGHRMLVSYLSGMRDSEVNYLKIDCIKPLRKEGITTIIGYDFKNSSIEQGEQRDWPLPTRAITCVDRQKLLRVKIKDFYKEEHEDHQDGLFFHNFANPNGNMRNLMDGILPDDVNSHLLKKMRPTAASHALIATRSPLTVQTVFGHADFEMTQGYYKSRPTSSGASLFDEIREQERRFNTKLGREIFAEISSGKAPNTLKISTIESMAGFVQNVAENIGDSDEGLTDEQSELVIEAQNYASNYKKYDIDDWTEIIDLLDATGQGDAGAEYIGQSLRRVSKHTLCGAGFSADFKGACSTEEGTVNTTQCKFHCRYQMTFSAGLDVRVKMINFTTEQMLKISLKNKEYYEDAAYIKRAISVLEDLYGFEGQLAQFKDSIQVQSLFEPLVGTDFKTKLAAHERRTFDELMGG